MLEFVRSLRGVCGSVPCLCFDEDEDEDEDDLDLPRLVLHLRGCNRMESKEKV